MTNSRSDGQWWGKDPCRRLNPFPLFFALLLIAVSLVACGKREINSRVSAQTLDGTWRGTVHQSPAGEDASDYPVVMVITTSGGSIDYPTLGCGGSLRRLSGGNTSAQFRENITRGADKCVNGGIISVNLSQGRLSWTYRGQQGGNTYTGNAVLERR
jgi:hypothetical protein